jgi:hypothetical protein
LSIYDNCKVTYGDLHTSGKRAGMVDASSCWNARLSRLMQRGRCLSLPLKGAVKALKLAGFSSPHPRRWSRSRRASRTR